MSDNARRDEWARHWPLPFVAMLGISVSSAYSYASGVFMEPITREFGWSRAEFTSAFTLQMLLGLIVTPIVGRILDRIGPRKFALLGIVPFVAVFSLFALATGDLLNWQLLSVLLAVAGGGVTSAIWVGGVVRGFNLSRGLATAITLAGYGVATSLWPLLAALYIEAFGWRLAFPAIAVTWGVVQLPLTFFFFRPPPLAAEVVSTAVDAALPPILPIVMRPMFLGLLLAAALFGFIQLGLIVHFVPILRGQGIDLTTAAGIAVVIGVFSVAGRLITGVLFDILPMRPVAVAAFAVILPVFALLLYGDGSLPVMFAAGALLGLAAGSEMDALTYIASRRFEPRIFGSIYSILQAGLAISASLGPLVAGWMFDRSGSYEEFILLCLPMDIVAAVTMFLVLKPMKNVG